MTAAQDKHRAAQDMHNAAVALIDAADAFLVASPNPPQLSPVSDETGRALAVTVAFRAIAAVHLQRAGIELNGAANLTGKIPAVRELRNAHQTQLVMLAFGPDMDEAQRTRIASKLAAEMVVAAEAIEYGLKLARSH